MGEQILSDLDLARAYGVIGDRHGIAAFADCIRKQQSDAVAVLKELVEAQASNLGSHRHKRGASGVSQGYGDRVRAAWKAARDLVKESS